VNLVVELQDDIRIIPQWSVIGHQSDEWLEGSVSLNLPLFRRFRVEFVAYVDQHFGDAKAEVNIDDVTFSNCGKYYFCDCVRQLVTLRIHHQKYSVFIISPLILFLRLSLGQ